MLDEKDIAFLGKFMKTAAVNYELEQASVNNSALVFFVETFWAWQEVTPQDIKKMQDILYFVTSTAYSDTIHAGCLDHWGEAFYRYEGLNEKEISLFFDKKFDMDTLDCRGRYWVQNPEVDEIQNWIAEVENYVFDNELLDQLIKHSQDSQYPHYKPDWVKVGDFINSWPIEPKVDNIYAFFHSFLPITEYYSDYSLKWMKEFTDENWRNVENPERNVPLLCLKLEKLRFFALATWLNIKRPKGIIELELNHESYP